MPSCQKDLIYYWFINPEGGSMSRKILDQLVLGSNGAAAKICFWTSVSIHKHIHVEPSCSEYFNTTGLSNTTTFLEVHVCPLVQEYY